jgi:hypothetical protein
MRRIAPLFALAVLALGLAGGNTDQTPFSRTRWKQEQRAWGARFGGDIRPESPERLQALIDSLAEAPPPAPVKAPGVVRISQDILPPISGPAGPETQTEPHLALNPEQETHLLAGYQEHRFADGGARVLTYAVSLDSGKSWSEGILPGLTVAAGGPWERASDPWVAFGPGGRAYYVSLAFNERTPDNGIFVSASEDGGLTWGPPVAVRTDTADFNDKEAIIVDTRTDSPYRGRVYVGWDTVLASQRQPVRFSYSDDGGASFVAAKTIFDQGANVGVLPLVGPGGVVYAVWSHFTISGGQFFVSSLLISRSTDGGDTWSAPATIADLRPAGVDGMRTGDALASAAVNPKTGDIYVVWQDERFSPGVDQVAFSRSTDGGETWSVPRRVSDGPLNSPNFTPAVAVNANGIMGIAYYSLRNDPTRQILVDAYLVTSRDRGRKFGRGVRLSTSWDVRFAAFSRGFFLGDYLGLVAARQAFHPFWIATFEASRLNSQSRQPDAFSRAIKVR